MKSDFLFTAMGISTVSFRIDIRKYIKMYITNYKGLNHS